MRFKPAILLSLLAVAFSTQTVFAHCEIPCGIYGDEQRIEAIGEHITTIEKSMKQVIALTQDEAVNYNQLVRWVMNKETHAEYLQEIVFQYFMTQRVKPVDESDKDAHEAYVNQLTLLHSMVVHAMKAKQTTDLQHVEMLRNLLSDFKAAYFGEDVSTHGQMHDH
jgi:nickel superoxide dismutase